MNICIPKERRPFEFRVGLSPSAVHMLTKGGHMCFVEHDAGLVAGFDDHEYEQAGARIVYSPHEIFGRANLLVKVARPVLEEINWLQPGTSIAGLLHLNSARKDKIDLLLKNKITAIALEQIQLSDGRVPVRMALAQIGGQMVPQIAARLLQNEAGGKGILLGGVAGVPPAEVVIIGAGIVGKRATSAFIAVGAQVTVLDTDINALQQVHEKYPGIVTMISNPVNIARVCKYADVLIGAVLVTGQRTPIVVTREMVRSMKARSVIMDISIDEGGCIETSRPTNHDQATFIEEGVIHYCVPNMSAVVARTSTHAYINAALPFIQEIADLGIEDAISENPAIEKGINTHRGRIINLQLFATLRDQE
jgi:alanine dehydrogenase